jgi:alkanesulfonate monooxygenase SsuD/methylene tetrahydromethanopterin reductase-like flavin-dependent oxidoreductase (luciferase family)
MTNHNRSLEFGHFATPTAEAHPQLLRQVQLAEELGYDLIGIQDHPYQRRYLDTFTLLPWLAARTERVRFFPDVAHLPLREPAMLAKAMASLDVLSGGRVELGIGAGSFAQASQAMGATARTTAESLDALEEAIGIARRFWRAPGRRFSHDGTHYRLGGFKPGPAPAHEIGIWVGGGGPKMLRLIGRLADGWISPGTRDLSLDELLAKQRELDHIATDAGRDPAAIRRVLGVSGVISEGSTSRWLNGPIGHWVEELASLAAQRFDTFIFWPDHGADEQLHAFAEVAVELRRSARATSTANGTSG